MPVRGGDPTFRQSRAGLAFADEHPPRPIALASTEDTAPARHTAADTEFETVSFATERDKALAGGWRTVAAQDGAFQWPGSSAKAPEDIARDMSLPGYRVTARKSPTRSIYFESEKGGSLAIIPEHEPGEYHIDALIGQGLDGGPRSGGAQLYQASLTWARNNGFRIQPDEFITPINELRRTSAMHSSALRHGTTDHMVPHADQRVPWVPGDHDANIAALARREAELVAERSPQTKAWSIDPSDGTFRDQHGKRLTADDVAVELRKHGGHDSHGVGTATLRRALLTRRMDANPEGITPKLFQDSRLRGVERRGVLYGERTGGTRPESLGGDGAPAPVPGFSEAELDRELATIRKAFPALLRRYDLQAGEVAKLLRTRGYEGEVPAQAVAALARLRGQKALIVLGARAFRDRASGAALLTHEVGHAYWDTLDDATRQTLRDLRTRELEAKTGPLFRDGQLDTRLAHVDEASERGVQEWFAERIARLNESWAHGRLDRADLPLLRRLGYSLREKLLEMWTALARRERLDPTGELFERRFREFFAGGAQIEGRGPGSRGVSYAQESGASGQPPPVRPWDAVKKGMPLDSVKKYIPKAQVLASRLDFSGMDDVAAIASISDFLVKNPVVTAFDGHRILLANPQGHGDVLFNRAEHLAGRRRQSIGAGERNFSYEKASLMASIPETLQHAMLKAEQRGEHLYFRRYKNGLLHMVVVDPQGHLTNHGVVDASLVTQYAPEPSQRFEGARVLAKGEL